MASEVEILLTDQKERCLGGREHSFSSGIVKGVSPGENSVVILCLGRHNVRKILRKIWEESGHCQTNCLVVIYQYVYIYFSNK